MYIYMATMASTNHGLSVWTNTCVKSAVNPRTGLNATLHDHDTSPVRCDNMVLEKYDNKLLLTRPETNITYPVARSVSGAYDENSALRGDPFYHKLQELKEENMKTLEAFEQLYQNKILIESAQNNQSFEFEHDVSGFDNIATKPLEVVANNVFSKKEETIVSKPPPGKPKQSLTYTTPIQSKTVPHRSTQSTKLKRPESAPTERKSHSLDRSYWHKIYSGLSDAGENFVIPHEKSTNEYEKALAKVDKLWEDFNISEYSQRRHSFSSSGQVDNKQSDHNKTKTLEWRHRITIPQPFKMSVREALKEKKRTPAQEELEQKRLAKQMQEEAECEKKFKAQSVPAHVYLPRYEEIMERNETRRRYVKEICQDLLQSQVKPFSFDIREKEKMLRRPHSAPIKRPEQTSSSFKARPVPKHIFRPDIDEKLLEEEELRKIRVKMRSRELLRDSSLPPNMAAREQQKKQERKEKAKLAKLAAKKQHQRINHDIPNYNALYNQFKKELERRRQDMKGTVVEPFNFETERISKNDKIREDMENNENRLNDNRWPFQNSRTTPRSSTKCLAGALSNSLDYIPAQTSRSAELRFTMTKKERDKFENRQKEEEEAEKRRRTRESKLRSSLTKTSSLDLPNPRDSIAERLKKMRKDDRERQETYEREIEEMKTRVQKSPLLVEQYMTEYAKAAAEKKFTAALNNAGLSNNEFVNTKSSRSTRGEDGLHRGDHSVDHHHDDDGDYRTPISPNTGDLTYTKSTSDD